MSDFFFKKNFKTSDPKSLKRVLVYASKEEIQAINKKVVNTTSCLKQKITLTLLTKELISTHFLNNKEKFSREFQKIDLCLATTQKKDSLLSQLLLANGIPILSLKGFLTEKKEATSYHEAQTVEDLFAVFEKLLLEEEKTLALLANISRNLYCQQEKKNLHSPTKKISFSHIINPVPPRLSSDLYIASPIVFQSFEKAKFFSQKSCNVTHYATTFTQEPTNYPKSFIETPSLERSVLDLKIFSVQRKLPILADILERLYKLSHEEDYLIYTNADIVLLPHFYQKLTELIAQNYDSIIINRRTISKKWSSHEEIAGIYSDIGDKHPGFDCFVFKRKLFPQFFLGKSCVGVHLAGRSLFYNLLSFSKKFIVLKNEHLTCHIGDDNSSKNLDQLDYIKHNTEESIKVLEILEKRCSLYTKIKEKKLGLLHGDNILKFNFAPGKFITKSLQKGRVISQNSLEKPLIIHSRSHEEADFFLKKISESKSKLLFKSRLKKQLSTQAKLYQEYCDSFNALLLDLKEEPLNNFQYINKKLDKHYSIQKENISWILNLAPLLQDKQYYTFDCSQSNLLNQTDFSLFTQKIKELLEKDPAKTIIHLVYKKEYSYNFKEAFSDCCHISFFENKAMDFCLDAKKLKKDPFYQIKTAFKLLCFNKTVDFTN